MLSFAHLLLLALLPSTLAQSSTTDSDSSDSSGSSSSSTKSASPTLVWVTSTINANSFTVFQSPYYQHLPQYWSDIASPKSGSVGLGRLNGTVGGTRQGNIVPSNDAASLISSINAELGTAGLPYPAVDPLRADSVPVTSDGVVIKKRLEDDDVTELPLVLPTGEAPLENVGNSADVAEGTVPRVPLPAATS